MTDNSVVIAHLAVVQMITSPMLVHHRQSGSKASVMDYSEKTISVVIPVYKSRESLAALSKDLETTLSALTANWEVIFVIDGCPQRSETVVEEICRGSNHFRGLVLARNHGQHYAILVGLKHADGDLVITMDDDLQNPASEIPKLLAAVGEDCQIAIGMPRTKQHNWFRNLSSRIMQMLVSTVLGKPRSLTLSSFRCLTQRAVKQISRYQGAYPFLPALMFNAIPMHEIQNVEVEHEGRKIGGSSYSPRQLVRLASFLLINHSMMLLRAMTVFGLGVACLAILTGIFYTARYLIYTSPPQGWTSLAVLVSLLSGVTLVSLGILGEYIGRIVKQTDANVQYSVYREIRY
jgi:glycosyltransferase involved in cell wall biosynthesis